MINSSVNQLCEEFQFYYIQYIKPLRSFVDVNVLCLAHKCKHQLLPDISSYISNAPKTVVSFNQRLKGYVN